VSLPLTTVTPPVLSPVGIRYEQAVCDPASRQTGDWDLFPQDFSPAHPRATRGYQVEVNIHSTFSTIFTMKTRWLGAKSRTALMVFNDPVCGLERLRHTKPGELCAAITRTRSVAFLQVLYGLSDAS
jgi:hypothetical protein